MVANICALLLAALALLNATTAQQHSSSNAAADRWIWGRRHVPLAPTAPRGRSISTGTLPRSSHHIGVSVDRRHSRVIGGTTNSAPIRNFDIETFPPSFPQNILDVVHLGQTYNTHENEPKTEINPLPKIRYFQTTTEVRSPEMNTNSNSFKVIRVQSEPTIQPTTTYNGNSAHPTLITPGLFPYPFGSKPILLGDGTSIGYAPHDTLPVDNPHANVYTTVEHKQPKITEEEDVRYTTLDKLFESRVPTKLPDPHTLPNSLLGGLHPDEVFYADSDLVIIKGGGFSTKSPYSSEEFDSVERETEHFIIKSEPIGNELGDANNPQPINVRPDELFSKVPLPYRFVNGNIPTIVKPATGFLPPSTVTAQAHHRPQRTHRLIHQSSFIPIAPPMVQFQAPPQWSSHYRSSSSYHAPTYTTLNQQNYQSPNPTRDYQTLDDQDNEIFLAEESIRNSETIISVTKHSPQHNVIHYNYQTRGNDRQPIVDYKIRRPSQNNLPITNSGHIVHNVAPTPQVSPIIHVQRQEHIIPGQTFHQPETLIPVHQEEFHDNNDNIRYFDELEDFSHSEGDSFQRPLVQTPKRRPSFTSTASTSHVTPNSAIPTQPSSTASNRVPSSHQSARPTTASSADARPPLRQKVISLHGDTRVNYLRPRPPINHQAEFLFQNAGHTVTILHAQDRNRSRQNQIGTHQVRERVHPDNNIHLNTEQLTNRQVIIRRGNRNPNREVVQRRLRIRQRQREAPRL